MRQRSLWRTAALLMMVSAPAQGADVPTNLGEATAIPHVGEAGQRGYQTFTREPMHRAFAIAPGGTWSWVSGSATTELAEGEALGACRENTAQPCQIYAVDDQVVLDQTAWAASWDLHLSAEQIAQAPVGIGRGNRFPDLALTAPDGRAMSVSQLKGKPVFVHFWGSWCPPCQAEFLDLQKLYDAVGADGSVAFVLVQARESIAKSQNWMDKRGLTMPLHDSGHQGRTDTAFTLADGISVDHRRLALAYPSSYVLDADGLVVYRQAGPGERWLEYEPLLRHLTRP